MTGRLFPYPRLFDEHLGIKIDHPDWKGKLSQIQEVSGIENPEY